jgi:hypothetical protein
VSGSNKILAKQRNKTVKNQMIKKQKKKNPKQKPTKNKMLKKKCSKNPCRGDWLLEKRNAPCENSEAQAGCGRSCAAKGNHSPYARANKRKYNDCKYWNQDHSSANNNSYSLDIWVTVQIERIPERFAVENELDEGRAQKRMGKPPNKHNCQKHWFTIA